MAWRSPTSDEANEEMVKTFRSTCTITTKEVENAFLNVPRAAFLPEELFDEAYSDRPIRGDEHLHMSAPHMYATVLEALELKAGMSFLNIGSGTGYFSMLAGFIIGMHGVNHGIELRANLVEHSNDCCDEFFMYMPKMKKQICYPQFMVGNCFHIDPMAQDYDRVYCGAACPQNKLEFLLKLVKPGGFVIVPAGNQLVKVVHNSSNGVKETILSDVCFESLVLPDNTQPCPKLRFAGMKVKKKKVKVYPPPGLLVAKNPARKLLARLRALQDTIDCLSKTRCIPKAFAYVPSFEQISQLMKTTKSTNKDSNHQPVEQTINFFNPKSFDKKGDSILPIDHSPSKPDENDKLWNNIQNDTIWETVLEYTYSLGNSTNDYQSCADVYTKQKKRKHKKGVSLGNCAPLGKNGSSLSKNISGNSEKVLNHETNSSCHFFKCKHDGSSGPCLKNRQLFSPPQQPKETYSKGTHYADLKTGEFDEPSSNSNAKLNENSHKKSMNIFQPDSNNIEKNTTKAAQSNHDQSKSKKNISKPNSVASDQRLYPIEIDKYLTNRLQIPPGPNWTADEDNQLVQLLINSFGCNTTKTNSKCLSKHISILPSLFSSSVLVRYPKIASYSPIALTYRALALFRVVQMIDYVIPFLCSSHPVLQSVSKLMSEQTPFLQSFTESSFISPTPSSKETSSDVFPDSQANSSTFVQSVLENTQRQTLREHLQKTIDIQKCLQGEFKEQQSLLETEIQLIEKKTAILHHMESHISQCVNEPNFEIANTCSQLTKERQENEQTSAKLKSKVDQLSKKDGRFDQLMEKQEMLKHQLETVKTVLNKAKSQLAVFPTIPPPPPTTTTTTSSEISPHRYNPSSILLNLTFLLPLSSRRIGIITELLRATEQPFSDRIPVIYIDRRVSLSDRLSKPKKSVFYQIYEEFKSENMNFRCNKRKCDQWWEVKFVGEGIIDQGGGFRDSLAELSDELCPQETTVKNALPLLVQSVNQRDKVGEYQDCFVPNPSYKESKIFHWLGMLMGAAYRSDESLTLSFPPFVWKLLAGEHVNWCVDFLGVDEACVKLINKIEFVSKEEFSQIYATDLDFTTALSDGSIVEVKNGGHQMLVDYNNRLHYCELVKKVRMMEFLDQVKGIREGLLSVIPQSLLDLITYQELERGVCGFNEISISLLKESIHYGDDLSSDSDCVLQLWKVLESFNMEDRSRFLRFVSGRKRLPASITLSQMCGEKDTLPSASTCASTLMLPSYSSAQVAEKKLRYAIYNCVAIDTDTNPW